MVLNPWYVQRGVTMPVCLLFVCVVLRFNFIHQMAIAVCFISLTVSHDLHHLHFVYRNLYGNSSYYLLSIHLST